MQNLLQNKKGFTLIELMIVVAIIALLASIGYPAYTDYVIRGKRSEGRATLLDAAAKQERYYSDNNQFATLETVGISTSSDNDYYTLSMTLDDTNNQSFTLTATPSTIDADCTTLTYTNAGTKDFTGSGDLKTCWGK